jgi:hypothetical protein
MFSGGAAVHRCDTSIVFSTALQAAEKTRVETGLAPTNATRKLWFDRFLKGPGFSRAVSIVLSLRLYSR